MDLFDFATPPLRDFLAEDVFETICSRARRASFEPGQALHRQGDGTAKLAIVAQGGLRFGRFHRDGAFTLVGALGPGAHFGDVSVQRSQYTHDVIAEGPCAVDAFDAATVTDLLNELPCLGEALWQASTARVNALAELYEDSRTLTVSGRLAKVIYLHAGRGAIPDGVACLQRDLAALLGVSQVSIGNALKDLERAGLIKAGYRCVTVPDKARLKVWLKTSGTA